MGLTENIALQKEINKQINDKLSIYIKNKKRTKRKLK